MPTDHASPVGEKTGWPASPTTSSGCVLRSRLGLLISIVIALSVVMSGASFALAAAEASRDDAVAESQAKPAQGERRLLPSLLGATPEERARLTEERKSLSATAAANGTDPTAIIGFNQLAYGHTVFTNSLNLETATAVIQVPFTPNLAVRATLPYVWADLDRPQGFTTNGTSDLFVRAGGRVYSSPNLALLVGFDASFPTASDDRLGTGKYGLGPGAAVRVPLARLRSLFITLVQDFNSVGGDPSRRDIHFMQVQPAITTIWSERWWTIVGGVWAMDWNNNNRTVFNLQGEIGHRLDDRWRLFAQPGAGLVGRDTPLGLDWTVQVGVRWMFSGSLFPERLFEALPVEGLPKK